MLILGVLVLLKCLLFNVHFSEISFLQISVKTRCSSMHFIVAENNKQSIEFYKRRGAADLSSEEGWRLFEIQKKDLVKMTAK